MDEARFLEELKKDFFEEAKLLIDSLEKNVLILEEDPGSKGAIDEVFRSVHTLKGGAATLDFDRIVNLTHVMEDLLDELRSDKLKLESDTIDLLLEGIDVIKELVESGEAGELATKGIEDTVIEAIKAKYVGVGVGVEDVSKLSSETEAGGAILEEEKAFKLSESEEELVRGSEAGGYNIYKIVIKIKDRSLGLDDIEGRIKDLYMRLCGGDGKLLRTLPEVSGDGLGMWQRRECLLQSAKDISSIENIVQGELDWLGIEDIYKYTKDDLLGGKDDVVEQEIAGLKVSDETLEIIYDFITSGKRVYKLLVSFKEDNPMRSLSGLLFYNVLSTNAQILQGMPSYEELRKTNYFYRTNEYVVGSNLDIKGLHRRIYISEVTSKIRFMEYKQSSDEESYYADKEANEISNVLESDRVGREFEKEGVKERREQHLLRVDSAKVDMLLNFVGELVIVKGTLSQVNAAALEELNNFTNMFVEHRRGLIDLSKELVRLDNIYASGGVLGGIEVGWGGGMQGGFGVESDGYMEKERNGNNLGNRFKQLRNKVEELYKNIAHAGIYFRSVHDKLKGVSQSVDRVTDDLQEGVMSIRMIPISQVFSRLPRLVRDISRVLKKEVSLVMQGEGTQLDKSVVQDLLDSLLHIIRNAVDHGIELPEERQAKGKPIKGTINLKAEHQGNTILITVKDDGRGISFSEIKKRAKEKQLFEEELELTKSDVLELLYKPGFTTSKTVSSISGRGVGMDVVRKKIEGISGSVSIDSKEGEWTEFSLKIPLTLVIIKALLIRLSENIYSISISAVVETARVSGKDIESSEELTSYVTIRGVRYIYINLCRLFDIPSKPEENNYRYIVIVNIRGRHVALSADALEGEQDIVIKPLKSKYTNVSGVTGATILGDGQVSLVLDVAGIFGEMEEKLKLRV